MKTVVVGVLFAAALAAGSGCAHSVAPAFSPATRDQALQPIPEVSIDIAFAGLTVEAQQEGPPQRPYRLRAGEEFAAVFVGRPGTDYALELVECEVFRRPGHADAPSSPSRYECRVTTRLKTIEGLERVLSARGISRSDPQLSPEASMRDAVRTAVAELAEKVRYHIAPVDVAAKAT
ncbi:hypothetical protein [Actomonas aquatica]|uniref:Lipoprotein n=1 Tax=Actomonas aquatica TaxID=2866162 RepID=A0ABZ1C698_9BACT|nr:hypothetical protein [Opitutus sp. WL0086]WRQ87252.1 hypothetical protein K1X11_020760 [Opitutus sp. WL0086]